MGLFSPDIVILQNAITSPIVDNPKMRNMSIEDKINKDYMELEKLQSSINGTEKFVGNLLNNIKNELVKFLSAKREKFCLDYEGELFGNTNNKEDKITIYVDGKVNLLHAIPYFALVIAVQRGGEINSGIICNPITQEIFVVEKGRGAFLKTPNDTRKIKVSQRKDVTKSLLAGKNIFTKSPFLDMCCVANGKYDGLLLKKNNPLNELGFLLVKEAGGVIKNNGDVTIVENGNLNLK